MLTTSEQKMMSRESCRRFTCQISRLRVVHRIFGTSENGKVFQLKICYGWENDFVTTFKVTINNKSQGVNNT